MAASVLLLLFVLLGGACSPKSPPAGPTGGANTSSPTVAPRPANAPPNVIIVVTDDEGTGDIGYGARDLETPNLDALAASGARFGTWYAAAPICSPSRAAILTGRYPVRAGVPGLVLAGQEVEGMPPSEVTLAELLKQRGYRTGLIGKWHLGSTRETRPNAQGFDYFFGHLAGCIDYFSHRHYWVNDPEKHFHDLWRNETEIWEDGRYMTELITSEVTQFIEREQSRPFFLFVAYNAPHYPMEAPQRYTDRFPGLPHDRRVMAGMMAAVDDSVGELVATLTRLHLREQTLVFFQSDNGASGEPEMAVSFRGSDPRQISNNGPFRGRKFSLFDGGTRVPAFVSWPGHIRPRQVVDGLGVGMDIFVTAARAAGAPVPSDRTIDGRDISAMLGGGPSPHDALFWTGPFEQRAIRSGPWKLVFNGRLDKQRQLTADDNVFLANVQTDPGEATNVRNAHADVVRDLTGKLDAWEAEVRRP